MKERIDGLDENGREALRLLLVDGNSSDYFALAALKKGGFAASHASILPGLQLSSNLVQRVPGQGQAHGPMGEYAVLWEIKPEFRPLVRRYFEAKTSP